MGCGTAVYPKNQDIETSVTKDNLVNALKTMTKKFDEEIKDIESHLKSGTPIKTYGIDGLDKETYEKRVKYLGGMQESIKEMITILNQSNDNLPIADTKEYLQKFYQRYYVAYDENNAYKGDVANFKQFAFAYKKPGKA